MSGAGRLAAFVTTRGNATLTVLVVAAAVTLPFVLPGYALFAMTKAICYGIGIVGLKLLTGYGGQFSLGHSAFLMLGAYVAIILAPTIGFPLAVALAAVAAMLLGALLGLAGLRIKGHYLGLLTFMVALAIIQVPKASVLVPVTGGSSGLSFRVPLPAATSYGRDLFWYWTAVAVAAAVTVGIHALIRSRFGRALQASRDNALAAGALGVNTALVDVAAFAISGACAGIAGGLLAGVLTYIDPGSFHYTLSILLFVGMAVTGIRSLPAAYIGGALIVFVPNWAEGVSRDLSWAVYGGTLLVLLYIQVSAPRLVRLVTQREARRGRPAGGMP
ncbi:MAG: branched-chain amino acid ABC transporter permease [Bauldia sp.]|nr:branched-chain amino acid ABC transporter permease [Bauldia sp.]